MKFTKYKLWISALAFAGAVSCSPAADKICTGDLLFVGIPMEYNIETGMASAIADATGNEGEINFIHTAILEVDEEGEIWIIDATLRHGVHRHPLDTLLKDFTLKGGMPPHYEVMRLKDNGRAAEYVENAKKFIGEPYDEYFMHGNGRHYCTELVYDSYVNENGPVFHARPMNFKNPEGEFPVYWEQLFAILGEPIPQDMPGTNPQDMHRESILEKVDVSL